ncbi:hypothetical protein OROMI_028683 [Orobanche minor]
MVFIQGVKLLSPVATARRFQVTVFGSCLRWAQIWALN